MFYIEKTIEVSASHHLELDYESKCSRPHGHNWIITIFCKCEKLNHNGMVVDFTEIKQKIMNKLDHHDLNKVLPYNPTAENIALWICEEISNCYKVRVQESMGNVAVYEK
jgi:6-pyruvoyltetrahydropterin/6-carboxytetrahydropterin synthase